MPRSLIGNRVLPALTRPCLCRQESHRTLKTVIPAQAGIALASRPQPKSDSCLRRNDGWGVARLMSGSGLGRRDHPGDYYWPSGMRL
jgi:hypothetical protein